MRFKKFYLLICFTILIILIFLFFPRFNLKNSISLVGNKYIPNINVYNIFNNITNKAIIKNNVDDSKIGNYNVECSIKFLFFNIKKNFNVSVVDEEKPLIELKGDNPIVVCPNKEYIETGFTAFDNYDGDITDKVNISRINNRILYSVSDSSNNMFEIEREIIIDDKEVPTINLKGKEVTTIYLGSKYIEAGYAAFDNCDGDITDKVKVIGNVDRNKVGSYVIKYQVSDETGNTTEVKRTVIVKKKMNTYGDGVIYLTFDDGSSYLTSQILDILDKENVKATFFVVSPNENTKRAYNSGHSIGLHSNTHNYSYIYSNSDNYFKDLENISNKVYNVIGIRPSLIRFPGGSSNTISKNYNRGIMSFLTNEVINKGYTYFDWNVDSNDAGWDVNNSVNIYYNVINNLSHNKTNVVLMHDSSGHQATVKALKDIIAYGKANGYTFKAITKDTPIVIHGVNN